MPSSVQVFIPIKDPKLSYSWDWNAGLTLTKAFHRCAHVSLLLGLCSLHSLWLKCPSPLQPRESLLFLQQLTSHPPKCLPP